jgi:hypothetical protein
MTAARTEVLTTSICKVRPTISLRLVHAGEESLLLLVVVLVLVEEKRSFVRLTVTVTVNLARHPVPERIFCAGTRASLAEVAHP